MSQLVVPFDFPHSRCGGQKRILEASKSSRSDRISPGVVKSFDLVALGGCEGHALGLDAAGTKILEDLKNFKNFAQFLNFVAQF